MSARCTLRTALAATLLAIGSLVATPAAQACDDCRLVKVVNYVEQVQPYQACVTKYTSCGKPYHVYVTKYRVVQVPVVKWVKVCY